MDETDPPPRKFALKAKSFEVANSRDTPAAPSVHEILGQNLAVQKAIEPEVLPDLVDHRNNRRRDYWVLMIGGNVLGLLAWTLLHANPAFLVFLLSFGVVFNIALLWIMYAVMSKY